MSERELALSKDRDLFLPLGMPERVELAISCCWMLSSLLFKSQDAFSETRGGRKVPKMLLVGECTAACMPGCMMVGGGL